MLFKNLIIKNLFIIILILVIVLMSGCKKDPGLKYPITNKEYQVGTDGLKFEFIDNAPPKNVFEETTFEIATDMWNKGAYSITEGYLNVIVDNTYMCILKSDGACAGISPTQQKLINEISIKKDEKTQLLKDKEVINNEKYVDSDTDEANNNKIRDFNSQIKILDTKISTLENQLLVINSDITQNLITISPFGEIIGKNVYYPEGTSRHLKFDAKAKKLDLLSVQHTSPIILNSCYNYHTELSPDLCIDPNPNSEFEKVCDVKDITLSSQGAPVAITKVETRILPKNDDVEVQFIIHVENKGNGDVISRYKLKEACSASKLRNEDWNEVILSEFGFSNNQYFYKYNQDEGTKNTITCRPNPLRLVDGKDTIKCTVDNSKLNDDLKISKSTPSYISQAYMRFDYGYTKSNTQNIIIESTNN
jgi:hypothetical protein